MIKTECVLENKTNKILWDFELHKKSLQVLINKKIAGQLVDFTVATQNRIRLIPKK